MMRLFLMLVSLKLVVLATGLIENCSLTYSYGDLRRWNKSVIGLLQIYMGPDGTNIPEMWGMLDGEGATGASSATPIQKTLCQQLGYNGGYMLTDNPERLWVNSPGLPGPPPVWLSNISCSSAQSHILQCDYNLNSNRTHSHQNDIYIFCDERSAPNAYVGEVILFPPKTCAEPDLVPGLVKSSDLVHSRSFGIVAIRQQERNWMYLLTDVKSSTDVTTELSHDDANTICRSAGYTGAVLNSPMTVRRANKAFNYKFNPSYLNNKRLLADVQCSDSFPCLHCCMSNISGHTSVMQTLDSTVDFALVIRCTFHRSKGEKISLGSEEDCALDANYHVKNTKVCHTKAGKTRELVIIAATLGVFVGLILSIVIVILFCWCIRHRRRRGGYAAIPDGNGGPGNDGNENH